MTESIASLVNRHREDPSSIDATLTRTYDLIRAADDPAIFITLRAEAEVRAQARELVRAGDLNRPLLGIPVAIKDNIDVAGMPTTAGCPAFAYQPAYDAIAVDRLRQAGAIVIGKTNLDQFATGLVGVRSPYGIPRNAIRSDLVPGGSSSGSAVAVARGIVPLALGTDTAGSGRIPAGLNNIVGLKPSLGLVSSTGVVPACRTLDCVSIFTLTAEDAFAALSVIAGHDPADAYSRSLALGSFQAPPPGLRIGVPRREERIFFGDMAAQAAFEAAIERGRSLGWTIVEVDFTVFFEAARLLYEGGWVAERTAAVGSFIAGHPNDVHPVTRAIIEPGATISAVDLFKAHYTLAAHRKAATHILARCDALMVPTAPTSYTLTDLDNDPFGPNARLGTYTNFVNLLDLCGISVPAALGPDRMPFGVTFLMTAGRDAEVASLAGAFHASTALPLGGLNTGAPPVLPAHASLREGEIALVVVGAHLSGMPLNHELTTLGARFLEATTTAPDYRLFALANTTPPKPGMLRIAGGEGTAIEIELWAMTPDAFGRFVAAVPAPLSIGSVRLHDHRLIKGFLVEAQAINGARDVSNFGGWRAAVAGLATS